MLAIELSGTIVRIGERSFGHSGSPVPRATACLSQVPPNRCAPDKTQAESGFCSACWARGALKVDRERYDLATDLPPQILQLDLEVSRLLDKPVTMVNLLYSAGGWAIVEGHCRRATLRHEFHTTKRPHPSATDSIVGPSRCQHDGACHSLAATIRRTVNVVENG